MKYDNIITGIFLSRENRFLAMALIDNITVAVHVKNTGRLKELLIPGAKIFLEDHGENRNGRKTRYSLIAVEKDNRIINVDSLAPNKVVEDAIINNSLIKDLKLYKKEYKYKNSRFDFYYETNTGNPGFIEVKGATLEKDKYISFPDAKTTRGLNHINELIDAKENGFEAMVIFVIQMSSKKPFTPNIAADKDFTEALLFSNKKGVSIKAYCCNVTPNSIVLASETPVLLDIF